MNRIYAAAAADLPKLAELARQFYSASRFLRRFDIRRFTEIWTRLLASETGAIFILEIDGRVAGTIGGVAYEEPYSGELVAQEWFWFVDPDQRGQGLRLYKRFELWAREKGCLELRMVHLADSMPEKVAAFYLRAGYAKVETLYGKRFE